MNLAIGVLIVAVASAIAIGLMLFVRRSAPEGSYFADGDRAAGVFGVLATGFALLLGFVIFLAFETYDESRAGAETEALVLAQQYQTAQFLPDATEDLTGEIVCYGRSVVEQEWAQMEEGKKSDDVNPWGLVLFESIRQIEPGTAAEEAAYAKWLDQTSDREEGRQDRLHGAEGVMPDTLWVVMIAAYLAIFFFMLLFADSGERAFVQAVLIGSVVGLMTAMLLTIRFLDQPFQDGVGGLEPVAMERTLQIIDELAATGEFGVHGTPPCDENGNPL